jgi:hypothetical protein
MTETNDAPPDGCYGLGAAFEWRGMRFEPGEPIGFAVNPLPIEVARRLLAREVTATWNGPRGWVVSESTDLFIARWKAPNHPTLAGTGQTPVLALDQCLQQLRLTYGVIVLEIGSRVAHREALTAELVRFADSVTPPYEPHVHRCPKVARVVQRARFVGEFGDLD